MEKEANLMKPYTILTAGALCIGGLTYVGCDRNDSASNTGYSKPASTAGEKVDRAAEKTGDAIGKTVDKTADAAKSAGDKLANAADKTGEKIGELGKDARQAGAKIGKGDATAPDAEGIRDVLAQVTEAALTEKGLDDLTERLVDADRNRIGSSIGDESPEHTALVKQFRADWKAKYGQDFDIKDEEAVYPSAMFTIAQGEVGDAAPSASEVATGQRPGDLDANREKGRNMASVTIKESHGMPSLTVPLIHELPDNWRIDVPDTIDAAKLRSNVLAHLQAAHAMKDQWPDNVQDAYAAVSHHVLMAILDKPVEQK
jgi:hypothetical protein